LRRKAIVIVLHGKIPEFVAIHISPAHVNEMDVQGLAIGTDLHGVVRNLHNPENTTARDPWVEIVYR
jgi:hypothetical protein